MKNIKKLSLILVVLLVVSVSLTCNVFANEGFDIADYNMLPENDKIMVCIPDDYIFEPYYNNFYYTDDDGNSIDISVWDNTYAPKGITALDKNEIQKVFTYLYINNGSEIDYADTNVSFTGTKKVRVNGLSAYELKGSYNYDNLFKYPFCAYLFATVEDIFVVAYEDIEERLTDLEDINFVIKSISINGTFFKGDEPSILYNFEDKPSYEEAILGAVQDYEGSSEMSEYEESIFSAVMIGISVVCVIPTVVLIIVAVVLIKKYSKNKKQLQAYQNAYGPLQQYAPPQNYINPQYSNMNYGQSVNQYNLAQPASNGYTDPNYPQPPSYVNNAQNTPPQELKDNKE